MSRILLVDDNAKLRELYKLALASSPDLEIAGEAGDGQEAIAKAAELHPDLVLLDLSMPRLDGLQALVPIRKASPAAHVVILSAFKGERLGDIARELGATDYVEKGVAPSELAARLEEILQAPPPPFEEPADARRAALEKRARELI